jgi:hypothetical protein
MNAATGIHAIGNKIYDGVGNLIGTGSSNAAANQTALAQQTVAPVNEQSQNLYNQALLNASAAKNISAPSAVTSQAVTGPTVRDAPTAYATDATGNMRSYEAALAAAADSTARQQQAATTDVNRVAPAVVSEVNTGVSADTLAPAATTDRVGVERVQTSGLSEDLRAKEIAAAEGIGTAPSAAMSQFQAGQSQVVRDQLAMAERARGSERAGARREAMIAAGAQGAQGNLAAASLAASEEQAKRVAAAAALTGIRSQDVTSSTNAATIKAQQANLQAQLDAAISQGNTAAINAIQSQQATLDLEAQKASVSAGLTQQGTQAGLATANLSAEQQKAVADAAARNKAAADYAASVNTAANQAAQNQTSASVTNAGATTKAAADYATATNTAAQNFAAANTATSQSNASLTQKQASDTMTAEQAAKTATASNQLAAGVANAGNDLATKQLQTTGSNAALTTGVNATNTQADTSRTVVDANKSQSDASAKRDAALIGAAAVGAAALSDVRAKEDIKKIPPGEMQDLAAHLNAYTFSYKPGFADGGEREHASAMAQELEKSALGKKFVNTGPDGLKRIDSMGLAAVMAAAAASSMRKRGVARG